MNLLRGELLGERSVCIAFFDVRLQDASQGRGNGWVMTSLVDGVRKVLIHVSKMRKELSHSDALWKELRERSRGGKEEVFDHGIVAVPEFPDGGVYLPTPFALHP